MASLPILTSQKQKRASSDSSLDRFLVTVNVMSSAGPLRFVVKEGETVAAVIEIALKCYAREGRRPLLGSKADEFVLYCSNSRSDVMGPLDQVWSSGCRTFVLCKRQLAEAGSNLVATTLDVVRMHGESNMGRTTTSGGGAWKMLLSGLRISSR